MTTTTEDKRQRVAPKSDEGGKTAADLTEIVEKIHDYQVAQNLNDSDLLRRFGGLGSTKTYKRILSGDTADLDADRWLLDYTAVWTLIETLSAGQAEDEILDDDLFGVVSLRAAAIEAMRENGNERLILIEGPSGAGKTKATLLLAAKFGHARVKLCQANETWKESIAAMLAGILRALGKTNLPAASADRLQAAIELLRAGRVCLVIDEAHHLGPKTLNVVKTLINETPGEFVLAAMGTLWRKLELAAYEESRQLTRNRMSERINLAPLVPKDVSRYLERRLTFAEGDLAQIVPAALAAARERGHFAFLKRVVKTIKRRHGDEPVTKEDFVQALAKLAEAR